MHGQRRLDTSANSRCLLGMSNVGLDRSYDCRWRSGSTFTPGAGEYAQLGCVAHRRARAVSFKISDSIYTYASPTIGSTHCQKPAFAFRTCDTALSIG